MTADGRAGRAVGEGAVEAAGPVVGVERVGADLVPSVPQSVSIERERVGARIGDREAVGVRRALVRPSRSPVDSVTVGATLATVTVWVAVLLSAPSESLDLTETVELAGPSGKVQSKLPPRWSVLKVSSPTWVPLAPQLVAIEREVVGAGIGDGEAVGVAGCPR